MIRGPEDLIGFAEGTWFMHEERPFLKLYHHTGNNQKENIIKTREFWSTSWNIQGTKNIENVRYVYFTTLKDINDEIDLQKIAMSPNRVLHFVRDGAEVPESLPRNWQETNIANDILELPVLWSAPGNGHSSHGTWLHSNDHRPSSALRAHSLHVCPRHQ